MVTSEHRNDSWHVPDDNKPDCHYCDSFRWVLDPEGKLKQCPTCNGGEVYHEHTHA